MAVDTSSTQGEVGKVQSPEINNQQKFVASHGSGMRFSGCH
jgi:hypothetical protein